jgi:hypothetical protein
MNNLNEQLFPEINKSRKNMNNITDSLNEQLFTDLSSTEAEVIQGGWDLIAYDGYYGTGKVLAKTNSGIRNLKYPNRISSIRIKEGNWALYNKDNYRDRIRTLGPGNWNLLGGLNNSINSLLQTS